MIPKKTVQAKVEHLFAKAMQGTIDGNGSLKHNVISQFTNYIHLIESQCEGHRIMLGKRFAEDAKK